MNKVRLINREVTAQQYPVCGRSLKTYGQAVFKPEFGGLVFEMSLEDYQRDKFDLIGQTKFQQQWVPEFFVAPDEAIIDPLIKQPGVPDLPPIPFRAIVDTEHKQKRRERTLTERAKAAGVWKKGMDDEAIKLALVFPD